MDEIMLENNQKKLNGIITLLLTSQITRLNTSKSTGT